LGSARLAEPWHAVLGGGGCHAVKRRDNRGGEVCCCDGVLWWVDCVGSRFCRCATGTEIRATQGGVVSFSGYGAWGTAAFCLHMPMLLSRHGHATRAAWVARSVGCGSLDAGRPMIVLLQATLPKDLGDLPRIQDTRRSVSPGELPNASLSIWQRTIHWV